MLRFACRLGAVSLLALVATSSGALAQSRPNWVDPPAQAADAPETPPVGEDSSPAKNPAATAEPASRAATPATTSAPAPLPAASAATAEPSPASSAKAARGRLREAKAARRARAAERREARVKVRDARRTEAARERAASVAPAPRQVRSTGLLNLRRLRTAMPARTAPRATVAQTPRASQRPGTVRQALRAGFQVMRVRTLEYPDGRRVTVLSRPDQDTLRDLTARY